MNVTVTRPLIRLVGIQPPPGYPSPDDWVEWGPREYIAFRGSTEVGRLAWDPVGPEGEDIVSVRKVSVDPEWQREGIASALMDELLADHPDGEIYMGRFLPDGRKWWTAYLAARPHLDPSRFTEHHDPDL